MYLGDEETRKSFKSSQIGLAFAGFAPYEVVPYWQQELGPDEKDSILGSASRKVLRTY